MSVPARKPLIPPEMVARAERVLNRWSGADVRERRKATEILNAYRKQCLEGRIAVSDEFRGD